MIRLIFMLVFCSYAQAECDLDYENLNRYEDEILRAAEKQEYKSMAAPLACILQMQSDSEGMSRVLSSSFLRPLLGGHQTPGIATDPRYKMVSEVLEKLAMKSNDVVQKSFVTEFSRGDWRFYTLFCEKGATDHCSVFLPDEAKVNAEPPLLAAASMMRLRKAYIVLNGQQRELVGQRIKKLYNEIPQSAQLKRKFIEQIYNELFPKPTPVGMS